MSKNSESSKKRRDNLRSENLCLDCANPLGKCPYTRCFDCLEKRWSNKKRNNIEKGVCVTCSVEKANNNRKQCEKCLEKIRIKRKVRVESGFCSACNNLAVFGKRFCDKCLCSFKNRKQKFKQNNKCWSCGNDLIEGCTKCELCYLKTTSQRHFKTRNKWKELKELFVKQKSKCPYSGIDLVLGKNTELDHIVSKHLGGSKDIDNVQWVEKNVNKMKWSLSESDFAKMIKTVYEHLYKREGNGRN